jgi:hypothetical protein
MYEPLICHRVFYWAEMVMLSVSLPPDAALLVQFSMPEVPQTIVKYLSVLTALPCQVQEVGWGPFPALTSTCRTVPGLQVSELAV